MIAPQTIAFLGSFEILWKPTISFFMCLYFFFRSAWNNSSPTVQIFYGIWYLSIIWKSVEKIQVSLKSDWNNGHFTCMQIYDNILLNSSWNEKCFWQKMWRKSKHILCSIFFFPKIMSLWNNVEKWSTDRHATHDTITRHISVACWMKKTTTIHSEYVILIAFRG